MTGITQRRTLSLSPVAAVALAAALIGGAVGALAGATVGSIADAPPRGGDQVAAQPVEAGAASAEVARWQSYVRAWQVRLGDTAESREVERWREYARAWQDRVRSTTNDD